MVKIDHTILPGTRIRLLAENRMLLGAVVHSTRDQDGFSVGAKLEAMVVLKHEPVHG